LFLDLASLVHEIFPKEKGVVTKLQV